MSQIAENKSYPKQKNDTLLNRPALLRTGCFRLLKSEAPDAEERKRLINALMSVHSENPFLMEESMRHIADIILDQAAHIIELLGLEEADVDTKTTQQ